MPAFAKCTKKTLGRAIQAGYKPNIPLRVVGCHAAHQETHTWLRTFKPLASAWEADLIEAPLSPCPSRDRIRYEREFSRSRSIHCDSGSHKEEPR